MENNFHSHFKDFLLNCATDDVYNIITSTSEIHSDTLDLVSCTGQDTGSPKEEEIFSFKDNVTFKTKEDENLKSGETWIWHSDLISNKLILNIMQPLHPVSQ